MYCLYDCTYVRRTYSAGGWWVIALFPHILPRLPDFAGIEKKKDTIEPVPPPVFFYLPPPLQ